MRSGRSWLFEMIKEGTWMPAPPVVPNTRPPGLLWADLEYGGGIIVPVGDNNQYSFITDDRYPRFGCCWHDEEGYLLIHIIFQNYAGRPMLGPISDPPRYNHQVTIVLAADPFTGMDDLDLTAPDAPPVIRGQLFHVTHAEPDDMIAIACRSPYGFIAQYQSLA